MWFDYSKWFEISSSLNFMISDLRMLIPLFNSSHVLVSKSAAMYVLLFFWGEWELESDEGIYLSYPQPD